MKVGKIIEQFRDEVDDTAAPYLWGDTELIGYLNEAEVEACRRARLLVDSKTAEVCQIAITADEQDFALDPRVITIRRAKLAEESYPLEFKSIAALDEEYPAWDGDPASIPEYYFADANSASIAIYPKHETTDTLHLTVVREPLTPVNDKEDTPEIPSRYHFGLINWMKHRGYMKPDSETKNPELSVLALQLFENDFGKRRSAVDERFEMEHEGYNRDNGAF